MKLRLLLLAVITTTLMLSVRAEAHHSFTGAYNVDKTITIKGKIFQIALRSPHSVFYAFAWLPLSAQDNSPVDLSGTWRWVNQEDSTNRLSGVDPGGRYEGLPLTDAGRMRADTYSEEWLSTSPLLQCRPRGPTYQPYGLDPMEIEKEVDPLSRQIAAYKISFQKAPGARMVWLDGRPHPSQYAAHTWEGFSTGKFKGPLLEITTTNLK